MDTRCREEVFQQKVYKLPKSRLSIITTRSHPVYGAFNYRKEPGSGLARIVLGTV